MTVLFIYKLRYGLGLVLNCVLLDLIRSEQHEIQVYTTSKAHICFVV